MEFKLNKIDTDIQRKLQEESSDKKVHNSESIGPSKDVIQDKKKSLKRHHEENRKNKKRFITIDGIKYGESVDVQVEKNENLYGEDYKGQILDLKK